MRILTRYRCQSCGCLSVSPYRSFGEWVCQKCFLMLHRAIQSKGGAIVGA